MSQDDVLDVLRELGGRATLTQIRRRCKDRWPTRSLHTNCHQRLQRLEHWGQVRREAGDWVLVPMSRV